MGITITPLSAEWLGVIGDAELELVVPFDDEDDRFHLAFSDGTLIVGEYDPDEDDFRYRVERRGRSTVLITRGILSIDPTPNWLRLAMYHADGAALDTASPIALCSVI